MKFNGQTPGQTQTQKNKNFGNPMTGKKFAFTNEKKYPDLGSASV